MKRYAGMILAFIILSVMCGAAHGGKTDDTLVWATDRETRIADPYFNHSMSLILLLT